MTTRLAKSFWTTTALVTAPLVVSWAAFADEAPTPIDAPPESKGLPQFDPHWFPSQIFWLAIMFGVLYLLMSRLTLPRIGRTLQARQDKISADLAVAEQARQQAEAIHTAYESRLNTVHHQAMQAMHDAGVAIKAETERHARDFTTRIEREVEALEGEIAARKQEAKDALQAQIAELASAAAQKIVGLQPDIGRAQELIRFLNSQSSSEAEAA